MKTGSLDIYLAGKVGGKKLELAEQVSEAINRKSINWLRSDGSNHSEHNWGFSSFEYNNENLRDWLQENFIEKLAYCGLLIAFVDTPDSFGTIAEVAFASSKKKQSYIIVVEPDPPHTYDRCPVSGHCGACGAHSDMFDAYWFVSHFPNVTSIRVRDFQEAVHIATQICELDSPIEHLLYQSLMKTTSPSWSGILRRKSLFEVQHRIGKYRADFAFPLGKILIEVDGHEFHSTKEQRGRDAQRDRYLQSEGWQVLRYTGTEIYADPIKCAAEIVETIIKIETLKQEAAGVQEVRV